MKFNLQPSSPSGQAGASIVGDPVLAVAVDAAVGNALVDVGGADLVLEAFRTLALENFSGIEADAAVLAFLVVAEHAAVPGDVLAGLDNEAIHGCRIDLQKIILMSSHLFYLAILYCYIIFKVNPDG